MRLDVYGNKLAMCDGYYVEAEDSKTYSIDMWVVEEGASKSGKSYSCTEKCRIGPLSNVLRPLCIWRNGIVCCKEKSEESEAEVGADSGNLLYLFNVTTKEWKKFHNCSAAYDQCDIFNYEKSLLSVLQHLG
ncbi:uncharacterized protein LOC114712075 [Neltuma alba]|uniref:uncharacterized protein LOC114712075 n=1 Tax=Neltuma alba TaxID=207710 RepID=UPI0010A3BA91|nr:uncharacterized protein LOC114712075 [Prosopis alba]